MGTICAIITIELFFQSCFTLLKRRGKNFWWERFEFCSNPWKENVCPLFDTICPHLVIESCDWKRKKVDYRVLRPLLIVPEVRDPNQPNEYPVPKIYYSKLTAEVWFLSSFICSPLSPLSFSIRIIYICTTETRMNTLNSESRHQLHEEVIYYPRCRSLILRVSKEWGMEAIEILFQESIQFLNGRELNKYNCRTKKNNLGEEINLDGNKDISQRHVYIYPQDNEDYITRKAITMIVVRVEEEYNFRRERENSLR